MNRAVEGKHRLSTPRNFRDQKLSKKRRKNEKISPIPAGRAQNTQKNERKNSKIDQKNGATDPKIEKWPVGRGPGGVGEGSGPQKCVFR
jgi:hypothetical protein